MAAFDITPKTVRRALTQDELEKLLAATPEDRRLVYEVAVCTGYRKGELTALTVQDLDVERCALKLAAKYAKGRKDSRQPVPAWLVEKLKASCQGKPGTAKLLEVDFHIDRLFDRDLEAAKITNDSEAGDLVFHSLRHTYCTLIIESGATLTEAQKLLRHSDPRLTANIYSHARQDRLQSTAEAVGAKVLPPKKYAQCMQEPVEQKQGNHASACVEKKLSDVKIGAGEGVRTLDFDLGKVALYH